VSYLDGLIDDDFRNLWTLTVGFCAKQQDVRWLETQLDALRSQPAYGTVRGSTARLKQQLAGLTGSGEAGARRAMEARVRRLCQSFATEDKQVLHDMKMALRDGILAFERYEAEVVPQAGERLMAALRQSLQAIGAYYARLADLLTREGVTVAAAQGLRDEAIPEDRGLPGHGGRL
jgi:hypothetical protein